MQSSNSVLNHSKVNLSNIIYDDLILTNNKQYVVSKMWYQYKESHQPITLHIQTSLLKIYEITKNGDIIVSLGELNDTIFDKIDQLSLEFIKSNGVTKKFGLKDVKYKTIVNEVEITQKQKINVLRLKILEKTQFYVSNKTSQKFADIKKLLIKNVDVKAIIEIDGLVIDINNNIIFTNIILRQILIKKVKPLKIELSEYSFVNSDSDNKEKSSSEVNIKDIVLNNHTEYLDQNTNISEKSNKINKYNNDSDEDNNESYDEENNLSSAESDASVDVENFLLGMKRK